MKHLRVHYPSRSCHSHEDIRQAEPHLEVLVHGLLGDGVDQDGGEDGGVAKDGHHADRGHRNGK